MVKYYCDICGRETPFGRLNGRMVLSSQLNKSPSRVLNDVCDECYDKVNKFVDEITVYYCKSEDDIK